MTTHPHDPTLESPSTPPTEPHCADGGEVAFSATEMAEHLLALVHADPTSALAGDVNPGAFAGFLVKRAGRRYYIRVEEIL